MVRALKSWLSMYIKQYPNNLQAGDKRGILSNSKAPPVDNIAQSTKPKSSISKEESQSVGKMAAAVHCLPSCLALPSKFSSLSIDGSSSSSSSSSAIKSSPIHFRSLSFSTNLSNPLFSRGFLTTSTVQSANRRAVVCEAAPTKKADSASKRIRQNEKRRLYNKARKSEIKTRMKKVLESLDVLRKKPDAQAEEILVVEKLIADAYSIIDKAVKVGTLHRNTGARRKSRLARRKKAVEIHHGWYTPSVANV